MHRTVEYIILVTHNYVTISYGNTYLFSATKKLTAINCR